MLSVIQCLLVIAVSVLGYTWIGYPVLLAVCARLFGLRPDPAPVSDDQCPHLHVVLAAYNEEAVIGQRVRNLLDIDYPADRIDIHVGTDGCSDRTADIVQVLASEHARIHLHAFDTNRGKPAVLKDLVAAATGKTVESTKLATRLATKLPAHLFVFTDANTHFRPDALQQLIRHFRDPAVGGTCGRLIFVHRGDQSSVINDQSITQPSPSQFQPSAFSPHPSPPPPPPEGAYWSFETRLKTWESSLDSCLGANGAIYAIRPECFWRELPANTMVDDLVIAMKVREGGKRVRYEPRAVAVEELPDTGDEWKRRTRIGAGDYQAVAFCRRCLSPAYGWFAWSFWSHKVLRWFTPHLLMLTAILAFAGSIILRGQESGVRGQALLCDLVSAGVLLLLLLWGLSHVPRRSGQSSRFSSHLSSLIPLTSHFLTMQAALFVGFLRWCRGNLHGAWHRTPR